MNPVGNHIAQVEQVERAGVRDDGEILADGEPGGDDLVVR